MKDNMLTDQELERLSVTLEALEIEFKRMFKHASGGFAEATMYDYDCEVIDVEVKSGIQSDVEDTVHTDNIKIDRKSMKPLD
ncbi:MAG: hypothetical protein ACXABY_35050 [Candidatus Thorarchaeota archaeon]|jgi:hypothetical protein